jgi:hypothetical protein
MKVHELIERLEQCDPDAEVYTVGVGGDFHRVKEIEPDVSHEKLSIVPYKEENFVWVKA